MATRGRPGFQPTNEQRVNVEIMVGLGIPEADICLIVRDRRDKPICRTTLRRHFEKELQTGATKLNARSAISWSRQFSASDPQMASRRSGMSGSGVGWANCS